MKQIREWLDSAARDFAAGVALYQVHGRSSVVRRALGYGATDFTRATLLRELEKLMGKCHAVVLEIPADLVKSSSVVSVTASKADVIPQKPTQTSDDVRRQRSAWFAERDFLHARLELLATNAERHTSGLRILDLSQLIAHSYDLERGRATPAPVATPRPNLAAIADGGEIRRLLANLRPQASKLKRNPDRAGDLAQVLADIHLLETKLKP